MVRPRLGEEAKWELADVWGPSCMRSLYHWGQIASMVLTALPVPSFPSVSSVTSDVSSGKEGSLTKRQEAVTNRNKTEWLIRSKQNNLFNHFGRKLSCNLPQRREVFSEGAKLSKNSSGESKLSCYSNIC